MRLLSLVRASRSRKAAKVVPRTAEVFTFPAPTRGWNARDSLSGMEKGDAITLDNYYPTTSDVRLRMGRASHSTGLDGFIETLMTYKTGTVSKMFAITSAGKIYDVTAPGAVGAPVVSGLSNGRWEYINFTTSGGSFLVLVNGVDESRIYDGTTWATTAITGVTEADLTHVFAYKRRLFFIEKNKLKLWYLAVDSIAGAATAFDISAQFKKGGSLMAGGSLTRDGGDGLDDLFVVISTEGEVVIYQGLDPATDFFLIGTYPIGKPIGKRCFEKAGADLAVITVDGLVGISQAITIDRSALNTVALSDRIRNAFNLAALSFKTVYGWQIISYPLAKQGSMVFVNVPVSERVEQHQYVMNAATGSWCRFKGWNANSWIVFNDRIYFGGNGIVHLADEGLSDGGEFIEALLQEPFFYPDDSLEFKHFKSARPMMLADAALSYGVVLLTDFSTFFDLNYTSFDPGTSGSVWDVATWDVDPWASFTVIKDFRDIPVTGINVSAVFFTRTKEVDIRINAIDVLWERGNIR